MRLLFLCMYAYMGKFCVHVLRTFENKESEQIFLTPILCRSSIYVLALKYGAIACIIGKKSILWDPIRRFVINSIMRAMPSLIFVCRKCHNLNLEREKKLNEIKTKYLLCSIFKNPPEFNTKLLNRVIKELN